jgi:hypothetical protein
MSRVGTDRLFIFKYLMFYTFLSAYKLTIFSRVETSETVPKGPPTSCSQPRHCSRLLAILQQSNIVKHNNNNSKYTKTRHFLLSYHPESYSSFQQVLPTFHTTNFIHIPSTILFCT